MEKSVMEPLFYVFHKLLLPYNKTVHQSIGEISDILGIDMDTFVAGTGLNITRLNEASLTPLKDLAVPSETPLKAFPSAIFSFFELAEFVSSDKKLLMNNIFMTRHKRMTQSLPFSKLLSYLGLEFKDYQKLPISYFEKDFLFMMTDSSPLDTVSIQDVEWYYPKTSLKDKTLLELQMVAFDPLLVVISERVSSISYTTHHFLGHLQSKLTDWDGMTIFKMVQDRLVANHGNLTKTQSDQLLDILAKQPINQYSASHQKISEAFDYIYFSKYYSPIIEYYCRCEK